MGKHSARTALVALSMSLVLLSAAPAFCGEKTEEEKAKEQQKQKPVKKQKIEKPPVQKQPVQKLPVQKLPVQKQPALEPRAPRPRDGSQDQQEKPRLAPPSPYGTAPAGGAAPARPGSRQEGRPDGPASVKGPARGPGDPATPGSREERPAAATRYPPGGMRYPTSTGSKPEDPGARKLPETGAKKQDTPVLAPEGRRSALPPDDHRPALPRDDKAAGPASGIPRNRDAAGGKQQSTGGTQNPVKQIPGVTQNPGGARGASPEAATHATRVRSVYQLPSNLKAGPGKAAVLEKAQGDAVLRQVNSARSGLHGVNARQVPAGHVSVNHDGSLGVKAAGGRNYKVRADGTLASYAERDRSAAFGSDGRIRSLRAGGLEVQRGPHNERRIVTLRADRSLLVSTGPRSGYLQRTVVRGDRSFVQRSYQENNLRYTRVYGNYSYRGVAMQYYLPRAYYPPEFYGWAYQPWRTPVSYSWGWQRDPWYGYYGGYFTPQTVYPNSALWLADYLMAETLRSAYLSRGEGSSPEPPPDQFDAPVTPEVKAVIAREVKQQLAREREAAEYPDQAATYGELSTAMRDPKLVFVVSGTLEVNEGDELCGLTAGDVLQLYGPPARGALAADVMVLSSKWGDCPARSVVSIALNDLQEMHNSMRERIYNGLEALRGVNGSNGIPPAPVAALAPPTLTEAAAVGPSDENVLAGLQAQRDEADQAEQQVIQSAFADTDAVPQTREDGDPN